MSRFASPRAKVAPSCVIFHVMMSPPELPETKTLPSAPTSTELGLRFVTTVSGISKDQASSPPASIFWTK